MHPALRVLRFVLRVIGLAILWPLRAAAWIVEVLVLKSGVGLEGHLHRRIEEDRLARSYDADRYRHRHDRNR